MRYADPAYSPLATDSGTTRKTARARQNHTVPGSSRPSASGLPVRWWRASRLRSTRSLNQPRITWPDQHRAEDQQQLAAGPAGQRGGDGHADRRDQGLARVRGPDQQERREVAQRERRRLGLRPSSSVRRSGRRRSARRGVAASVVAARSRRGGPRARPAAGGVTSAACRWRSAAGAWTAPAVSAASRRAALPRPQRPSLAMPRSIDHAGSAGRASVPMTCDFTCEEPERTPSPRGLGPPLAA